jgi:hypothetical protein
LDGIVGEGDLRHLAHWQGVKTILRVEEESDDGVMTIREKEQFSHALNLLFADGRTAVLTANEPPEEEPAAEPPAMSKESSRTSRPNGKCHVEEA